MSDVIKLLPDSVANQIAAGEVIQRPASVIKELVENAVDAGASHIHIVLRDAGRTLIQVIDDGQGMSPTDARLAFERHSTSKIREAADLFTLHTMGFRGEALASIAAIAHVELRTCLRGEQLGTRLLINASQCESQEPYVCPVGANFMVKDLFFNVPARRKFLKSNQVELSNIIKEFEKLALVNYNVEFKLTHNDKNMYHLLGGSFKQRIVSLFGNNLDQQLVPLAVDTSLVKINGFVSRPENARRRGALQFLFVNGRYMRHPYFSKAVATCYENLIAPDAQPLYFLDFTVDPETIDVNIHPTKTEIKFENEVPIWQIVAAAVREALGRYGAVPSIDFDNEGAPAIPAMTHSVPTQAPPIAVDPNYNPFKQPVDHHHAGGVGRAPGRTAPMANWEDLYREFEKSRDEALGGATDVLEADGETKEKPIIDAVSEHDCFQLDKRFVVASTPQGLLLIDQHRAHATILYHAYCAQAQSENVTSQSVLFPEVLHLTPAQNAILLEVREQLESIGFSISPLGADDWAVNAMPAGLQGVEANDLLMGVVDDFTQGSETLKEKLDSRVMMAVASRAAISRGRVLTRNEMNSLVNDLLALPENRYTPSGKMVYRELPLDQIEKMLS